MKEIISFIAGVVSFLLFLFLGYKLMNFFAGSFSNEIVRDIFKIIYFFSVGLGWVYVSFLLGMIINYGVKLLFK
jgi:hypothetical protein